MAIGAMQLDLHGDVVAGHDHFRAAQQLGRAGHVGRAEVKLRTIAGEERRMTAALFLGQDVNFRLELRVRRDALGSRQNLAALEVFLFNAAEQHADVVAGLPSSSVLLNASTPVMTVVLFGLRPTISMVSPTLALPRSIRPVPTVPRPLMLNTSSTGIRNGLSISRCGIGTYSSSALTSSSIGLQASSSLGVLQTPAATSRG